MTRIALRVERGALVPADDHARKVLRDRNYDFGDIVFAEIRKPRNPKYHRLAHALGKMVADNVDDFEGMPAHRVLKRLQLECGAGCDEIGYRIAGQMVVQRLPKSISFESMDQDAFAEFYRQICHHIGKTYFGGMTAEQVAEMVELMPADPV